MEQSPWETNSHSTYQEITCLLWNSEVHYRVHRSLPLVPILSQINPVHNLPLYFYKNHSSIIFPSTPRSSEWPLTFRYSDQNFVRFSYLSPACYMPHPSHPLWSGKLNKTWWSIAVTKLLVMQSSVASRHFLLRKYKCSPQHHVPPLLW